MISIVSVSHFTQLSIFSNASESSTSTSTKTSRAMLAREWIYTGIHTQCQLPSFSKLIISNIWIMPLIWWRWDLWRTSVFFTIYQACTICTFRCVPPRILAFLYPRFDRMSLIVPIFLSNLHLSWSIFCKAADIAFYYESIPPSPKTGKPNY